MEATIPAAGVAPAKAFSSNTFLAVFAFLLAKIIMWKLQLAWEQTYHREKYVYKFLLFRL